MHCIKMWTGFCNRFLVSMKRLTVFCKIMPTLAILSPVKLVLIGSPIYL